MDKLPLYRLANRFMDQPPQVTQLLAAWQAGDQNAEQQLADVVYQTLRKLSARQIHGEKYLTLQATELVHEAYLKLVDIDIEWQSRAHFYAVASRLMRRLLIDRARSRLRKKHGGELLRSDLDIDKLPSEGIEEHLLTLDTVLSDLESQDQRKCDVFELHFFGGMSYREIAEVLKVSEATVDRDLRFAKAWVCSEMED
ncbi:RNA polymerase ECF family sigma subunit [Alteromonadaceae bacterium 2753L.S.0a.02]|nr:RNA polymerase ECF family sigma subunit [Alteromonadaceae bacterium 2753L.S.0a.02]